MVKRLKRSCFRMRVGRAMCTEHVPCIDWTGENDAVTVLHFLNSIYRVVFFAFRFSKHTICHFI